MVSYRSKTKAFLPTYNLSQLPLIAQLSHCDLSLKHLLRPELTRQPPGHHLGRRLGLIIGHHVATCVQPQEGEVAAGLDLADLLAIASKLEVLHLGLSIVLLAGPLESLGPGLVAEPVADVVGVAGVDEDGDLLEEAGDDAVVRLHPVALEQEVAVDVEVAAVVRVDLCTDGLHDFLLVEVRGDPVDLIVAKAVAAAGAANIIDILAGALVWANHSVIAIDRGRNTAPHRLRVVAVLDQASTAGIGVIHRLALALIKNSRPATLTTGHGAIVLILSKAVGKTITNKDRLEVDVALFVRENLRGKDGDIVSSIGLS